MNLAGAEWTHCFVTGSYIDLKIGLCVVLQDPYSEEAENFAKFTVPIIMFIARLRKSTSFLSVLDAEQMSARNVEEFSNVAPTMN